MHVCQYVANLQCCNIGARSSSENFGDGYAQQRVERDTFLCRGYEERLLDCPRYIARNAGGWPNAEVTCS